MIIHHLIPGLGDIPISKLRPSQLKGFYAKKLKSGRADGKPGGLSPRSVQYMHVILKLILKSAVEDELVPRNVAETVTPPRVEKPRMKYWEWNDAKKFLAFEREKYATNKGRYYPVYLLALSTGMRRGELLGLKWRDLDFNKKTLTLRHSLVETGEGPLLQDTVKTATSYRSLDLSGKVIEVLREHRERQLEARLFPDFSENNKADLVFTANSGKLVAPRNMDKYFRYAVKKAGVPDIGGIHALRHTYATRMLEKGLNSRHVQERLGHANIATTLGTYSHVSPQASKEIAAITDDLF